MSHSKTSPSSAAIWMNCPGALTLIDKAREQYGESGAGAAAAEGTRAHKVAEIALRGGEQQVDDDMWSAVKVHLDYVQTLRDLGLSVEMIEMPVWSPSFPQIYGTADYVAVTDDRLHIVDYKHGQGVFVAAGSLQLQIYAFIVIDMLGGPAKLPNDVRLTVVQPRYPSDEVVRHRDESTAELYHRVSTQIRGALHAIIATPDKVESGPWCRWCRGKSICPAKKDELVRMLNGGDDLAEMLTLAREAKTVIKATEQQAKNALRDGKDLDGWELRRYDSGRERLMPTKTKDQLVRQLGDDND